VGCGLQGREHLECFARAFPLADVALFDRRREAAEALARLATAQGLPVRIGSSAADAIRHAELVVTTTPSTEPWLMDADVGSGAFVAAVGADNPQKSEIHPDLLARSAVVVDSLDSASTGGDLRGAIAGGRMTAADVRGELPAIVAGRAPGRLHDGERIVFDSTGLAAADLAAATLAFDAAAGQSSIARFRFGEEDAASPPREGSA
jgi:ornithine cyclodeaminase/alanine dehydrogenase-like protein (mu-crystallin family)